MVKRIILITICVLLICALIFAIFIGAFLCYWVWDWEKHQDSLEKTPEYAGLSEWESDTSPKIILHIPDAGGSYCTISEKDYLVDFVSEKDERNIFLYELTDGWYKTEPLYDGTIIYADCGIDEYVLLFDVIDFDYQETEFIVYIEPREDDIFAGEVSKITFTKK